VQRSIECFCGNDVLEKNGPAVSDEECDRTCSGDELQQCGGI